MFEIYEPNTGQAKKIEEVQSAYKFLYQILRGLVPPKEYPQSLDSLRKAISHLHDSWRDANQAIIFNDAIQKQEEPT